MALNQMYVIVKALKLLVSGGITLQEAIKVFASKNNLEVKYIKDTIVELDSAEQKRKERKIKKDHDKSEARAAFNAKKDRKDLSDYINDMEASGNISAAKAKDSLNKIRNGNLNDEYNKSVIKVMEIQRKMLRDILLNQKANDVKKLLSINASDLTFITKLIHHAGYPHGPNRGRIQISRDHINDEKYNFAIGLIYLNNNLYGYGVLLNLSARNFTTTSSININLNEIQNHNGPPLFTETNFYEPVIIGEIFDVLTHYEKVLGTSLINHVDIRLILASWVWNKRFPLEVVKTEMANGIGKLMYELYDGETIKLNLDNIVDDIGVIKFSGSHNIVKKIIKFSCATDLSEYLNPINSDYCSNSSSEKEKTDADQLLEPNSPLIHVSYNFKTKKINRDNSGLTYEIPNWIAENLINNNSITINKDQTICPGLKKMQDHGIVVVNGDLLIINDFFSICYEILFQYWSTEIVKPNLIVKEELQNYLIKEYKITTEEADVIINCENILKRRLCIKGRPYLYYHIGSNIFDISRDYSSIGEYVCEKVLEYSGDLYKIYQELEQMIDSPNPEILTSAITRLIAGKKLYWSEYGILHNDYYLNLSKETKRITETILDEFVLAITNKINTDIEIPLTNSCSQKYVNDLCNKLNSCNYFRFTITEKKLTANIIGESGLDYYTLPKELIFMPFELTPYLGKLKRRKKITLLCEKYILNYVPNYNTISYVKL